MQTNHYHTRLREFLTCGVGSAPPYNSPALRTHTLKFNMAQFCHGQFPEVLFPIDLTMHYVNRFIKMGEEKADVLKDHYATAPLLAGCAFDPYHYRAHTENICLNALEGFLFAKQQELDKAISSLEHRELAKDLFMQLRALLLAAMYHDAGHTYGLLADGRNVAIAASIYQDAKHSSGDKEHDDYDFVPGLILSTEFPHDQTLTRLQDLCQPQQYETAKELALILRDADMMGGYVQVETKLAEIFVGLFLESKLKHPDLTIEQFHENQKTFQNTMVKWNTDWAKDKAKVMQWDTRHLAVAKVVTKDNPTIKSLVDNAIITI